MNIAKMKPGSKYSTHELFEQYGDVVYRRCLRMLGDDDAAHDALQEVFLRVIRDRQFRGDCSPMTWLYRIATTYCLQQLRNQSRRTKKLQELSAWPEPDTSTPDMEGALTVERILSEQDEMTQKIAYLRFVDGLTLEETADVLGISRKTITRRMRRMSEDARRTRVAPTEGIHG